MSSIRLTLLGTALLAGIALPVLAQPGPPPGAGAGAAARERGPEGRGHEGRGHEGRGHGQRGPGAIFARVDANSDGRVVLDEAWGFVQARFTDADRNKDGALVLEEALTLRLMPRPEGAAQPAAAPQQGARPMQARMIAMMFRAVDVNRDGRVTPEELRPLVEAQLRAFDANGDNGVTLDELPAHSRRGGGHHGPHHGRGPGPGPGAPDAPPPAR